MSAYFRTTPRRRMTALANLRRRIQKLTPYLSLILLAVPVLLVEPFKFLRYLSRARGIGSAPMRFGHRPLPLG